MNTIVQILTSPAALVIYLIILVNLSLLIWLTNAVLIYKRDYGLPYKWKLQSGIILLVIITFTAIFYPHPQIISPQLPLFDPIIVSDQNPLVIEFDRPIPSRLKASISNGIPGTWTRGSTYFTSLFPNTLIFTPHQSLPPESEISILLTNITNRLATRTPQQELFNFITPSLPEITNTKPSNHQVDADPYQPITLTFNQSDRRHTEINLEIRPPIEYSIEPGDTPFSQQIKPVKPLQPGTTYQVNVIQMPQIYDYTNKQSSGYATSEPYRYQFQFETTQSPFIKSITPQADAVLLEEPLQINFKHPIVYSSLEPAFQLTPETAGSFEWQSDQSVIFTPSQSWQTNTTYNITITPQIQAQNEATLDKTYTHSFTTIGPVSLLNTNPEDQSGQIEVDTPIQMTFNQPVHLQTAQDRFTITPNLNGDFTWQDRQLTFKPYQPLEFSTTYTVTFQPGIQSPNGLESDQPLSFTFTTSPSVFRNQVPLYKQPNDFTCYAAASRMVLEYRGVEVPNQSTMLEQIGFQNTERNFITNTWGDPNKGIVGTIEGGHPGGYGVHWQPVANMLSQYRPTEVKRHWNLTELLETVAQGHPVMVWWVNGVWPAKDVSWNTPNGSKVYTVNGMHVEVVTGWVGYQDSPEYILTNDPWRGRRQYTPENFKNLWAWFSNTAVIVY